MNWVSLLLQLVNLRKSLHESQALIESAKSMAEKGKRTLVSLLVVLVAGFFFLTALLVAVIDLGIQLDRGAGVSYSGLMISASIFASIGFLLTLVSWLVSQVASAIPAPAPPSSGLGQGSLREDRVKDLLEDFLTSFLTQLVAPKKDERSARDEPHS